jgi:two-component system phosphate regulon sensor histidine kinase PhoR
MSQVWAGATLQAALIVAAAGVALAVGGPSWGLVALVLGFALLYAMNARWLAVLVAWVRMPPGSPLPAAPGMWGVLFSQLGRRARQAIDENAALSTALARFSDAAHAMPDGVIILAEHDIIEWMNRTAESHIGLDRKRDIGSPITNLVRQPEFVSFLESAYASEPLMLESTRNPGQTLALQIVPFGGDRKLVVARDVTHLEKLESVRRDFVANVSHELKTPLTVVRGFLETVTEHLPDMPPEEAVRFLNLASEQTGRMQRLVDDLLTLAKLETASPPPLDEEIDVSLLLAEVTREVQALSAGRHNIEVEAGEAARLLGSAAELHSAFLNLASNAVRYTPAGGRIALRWGLQRDGSGSYTVEDTGIGIDPQHLPRLTERFYRVDRGRSRETGGTGLGLAIVNHVLTRHRARLEVTSEPGKGSRFSARFPANRVLVRPARPDIAART